MSSLRYKSPLDYIRLLIKSEYAMSLRSLFYQPPPHGMPIEWFAPLLTHKHRKVRSHATCCYFRKRDVSPELQERAMTDKYWKVRGCAIRYLEGIPTLEQFERCINDPHAVVREEWKSRAFHWEVHLAVERSKRDREQLREMTGLSLEQDEIEAL